MNLRMFLLVNSFHYNQFIIYIDNQLLICMQQKTERDPLLSTIKMKEAVIDKYTIIKVLLNGDILAKDHHQQLYILCHTQKKNNQSKFIHFQDANIIQSVQIIEEEGNSYEVYPFEKKMIWAGDLSNHKERSQIFCVTLLYSTIRNIIKPLKNIRNISNPSKYICLENIWIRDSTVFLLFRNKNKENSLLRTETISGKKNNFRYKQTNPQNTSTELSIIKRVGEVFWSIFYQNEHMHKNQSKTTFKEILKSMMQQRITLIQLEDIMQNNTARKTFIKKKRNTIDINATLHPKRSIDQRYSSINQQYQPFTTGIYRRLLFQTQRQRQLHHKQNRLRFETLIDSQKNNIPPSFRKEKRYKRRSLFDQSRSFSRGTAPIPRNYDNQNNPIFRHSLTPNEDNKIQNNNFKVVNIEKKKHNNRYFLDAPKRRSILQISIQDIKTQSYIQNLQRKSAQKALIKVRQLKQSIDSQRQDADKSINDQKLKFKLRQMRSQHKKQLNSSMTKVYESLSNNNQLVNSKNRLDREYTNQLQKIANVDMILNERLNMQQNVDDRQEMYMQNNYEVQRKVQMRKQYKNNEDEERQLQDPRSERNIQKDNIYNNSNKQQNHEPAKKQKLKVKQYPQQHNRDANKSSRINLDQVIKPSIEINKNTSLTKNTEVTQMNKANSANLITSENKIKDSHNVNQHNIQMFSLANQNLLSLNIKKENQNQNKKYIKTTNQIDSSTLPLNIIKQPRQQQKPLHKLVDTIPDSKQQNKQNIFAQVQKNMFLEPKTADDYVYVSRNDFKRPQIKQQSSQKDLSKPPIKKEKGIIRAPKLTNNELNDQIEQVNIGIKKQPPPIAKIQKTLQPNINPAIEKKKEIARLKSQQSNSQKSHGDKKQQKSIPPTPIANTQKSKRQQSKNERINTNQSNASSNAGKSIRKQIDEYIHMINKMGEAVAKTAKLSKKLEGIQWYVGVYFLYKRFYCERKKIERYLQESIPKLTRYDPFNEEEWKEWLLKGQIDQLLEKCKEDNKNITASIKKMAAKISVRQLPGHVLLNVPLQKNIVESTLIAIEYVVDQYDQAVEKKIINDPQIFTHLCEMVNALYVIGQLDKKIREKKPVQDYSNVKRSVEQLANMVQTIFDLYQ